MGRKKKRANQLGAGRNRTQDYHTQRNNTLDPNGTCNVTSYTMAAIRAGVLWPHADNEQPEDVFARFLLSKESITYMRNVAPWAEGSYQPYEVHAMLAWGYNKLAVGRGVAEFRTSWSLSDLIYLLAYGAGVVVSGDFPHYRLGRIGHIVSIAGIQYKGRLLDDPTSVDTQKLEALILDDPYGNYHLAYNPHVDGYNKGNDVVMPRADVISILKNTIAEQGYWAHVILPTSADRGMS